MTSEAQLKAALGVVEAEMADKVVYGPRQQARVDELVSQSMGRAARTLRAENTKLQAQVDDLQCALSQRSIQVSQLEKQLARARQSKTATAGARSDLLARTVEALAANKAA